jgi:PGF-CTERM protein
MHTNTTPRSLSLVAVIVVAAFAGVAVPGAVAAQDAGNETTTTTGEPMANATGNVSLVVSPNTTGATANHTVNVTVGSGSTGDLTDVSINYSGNNVSTLPAATSVQTITVANESLLANATVASVNDEIVRVSFDTNRTLGSGDQLSFVYQVVNPPEAGTYDVGVRINPENNTTPLTANMTIAESETTTTESGGITTTAEATTGETTTGKTTAGETTTKGTTEGETTESATTAAETTAGGADATGTTNGNGPGFGVVAGIVGVLAATLLALRRE